MQVYNEINIDLKKLNFDIETIVLKLMTKGVEVNDYENFLNILIDKIKKLQLKKSTIIQELDLLFVEDKSKYERGKKLWLSAIDIAFTKVCDNFQDGCLKKDVINNNNLFFQSYMQVYSKVYYALEKDKIEITDCGIFYAYTIYEIKNEIQKRETELLLTVEMKDGKNNIDLSNKEQFPELHNIVGFLNSFTPYPLLDKYWAKQYDPTDYKGEANEKAETEEQRNKDIIHVIAAVKSKLIDMAAKSPYQVNKLKFERDNYLGCNIVADEQRAYCIKFYNQQVIEEIERYINFLITRIETNFNPFFSTANKEDLLRNKSLFKFFYEAFGDETRIAENRLTGVPNPNSSKQKDDKAKDNNDESLKLSDFVTTENHKKIIDLLSGTYCQKDTFIWIDKAKGNKSILAAIIKYLHPQGYYKENREPTNEQIKQIAKNTFSCKISIDTIKKAKPENHDLKFINTALP
jgi:hypothetical protein